MLGMLMAVALMLSVQTAVSSSVASPTLDGAPPIHRRVCTIPHCRGQEASRLAFALKLRGGLTAAPSEEQSDESVPSIFYVHEGLARSSREHMGTKLVVSQHWRELRQSQKHDDRVVEGAAAAHSAAAREEAAGKLLANHLTCVLDMTNPYPRSQLHLARLPVSGQVDADDALCEVARRLIGTSADTPTSAMAPTTREAAENWVRALNYIKERLQVSRAELRERDRDMSPEAGAALRAVLNEVANLESVLALRGGATHPASGGAALGTALALRGGASQSQLVLGLNLCVHLGYGLVGTCRPQALLTMYDWSGEDARELEFLSPAHGLAQFLGSLQLFLAWLDLCALGWLPALAPRRDLHRTLVDLTAVHSFAAAVGAYRAMKGLGYSLAQAATTPLPGSLLAAYLCWTASKTV